jgi:hypothetical protein
VILTITGDDIEALRDALGQCEILLNADKKQKKEGPYKKETADLLRASMDARIETINALRQALATPSND